LAAAFAAVRKWYRLLCRWHALDLQEAGMTDATLRRYRVLLLSDEAVEIEAAYVTFTSRTWLFKTSDRLGRTVLSLPEQIVLFVRELTYPGIPADIEDLILKARKLEADKSEK